MPGKTPREAVKAYAGPLQKNVSLVCKGVLLASNYDELDLVSTLALPDPVSLNGRNDLFLAFAQQYKIIAVSENGPYRVTTAYYKYAVETEGGDEIIGYHWHPDSVSPITFPHLHLGRGAQIGRAELDGKAHFPTARIAFEDVIELLIGTFNVKPDRTLWQEIAHKTKALFMKHKSW